MKLLLSFTVVVYHIFIDVKMRFLYNSLCIVYETQMIASHKSGFAGQVSAKPAKVR